MTEFLVWTIVSIKEKYPSANDVIQVAIDNAKWEVSEKRVD